MSHEKANTIFSYINKNIVSKMRKIKILFYCILIKLHSEVIVLRLEYKLPLGIYKT